MSATINEQTMMLLLAAGMGALVGFVYDIFRMIRSRKTYATWAVGAQDALFWVACALLLALCFYSISSLVLRGYLFLFAALGLGGYLLFFSRPVRKGGILLIDLTGRTTRKVTALFLAPILWVARPIWRKSRWLADKLKHKTKAAKKHGAFWLKTKKILWKNRRNGPKPLDKKKKTL